MEASKRIEYFDVLRGLAIFCVVAIHSSGSGLQFVEESINFNFTVLWRNALNFGVPMFLAISGFFLAKKPMASCGEYFEFLKKQIPRVYFPLLAWSLVWFGVAVFFHKKSVIDELVKLVLFQSSASYYFIALIIQYYLFLPLLKKLSNRKGLIFSVFVSMVMIAVIYFLRYHVGTDLPLIIYAGNFATWQIFFVLGLYLGSVGKIKIPNSLLAASILVFYILSCLESYALISCFNRSGDAVTAVKASSFMYSFFLIIFLFKNQNFIASKILKRVGAISFGIYLTHMFALAIASRVLPQLFPKLQEITYVYQFFLIGIVMLSCYLCISAFNKIFSKRQAQLIGFK